MTKLGSAGSQRIDAIAIWLKSQVGAKANGIVAQLRNYPVAAYVEAFEQLARDGSNQGGSNSGRSHEEPIHSKIPGYDQMSYAQRRAAQDARAQGRR